MPLLRRKRFKLEPVPSNLRADEEVFYVEATGELFRDYTNFFNRTILCNSYVWDCEYTGKSGCTYAVALKSENEAKHQIDSLPRAIQRTIVTLVHNVVRSGVNGLAEEITSYLRERYQPGEVVEYSQKKQQVTVIEVFQPPIPEAVPSSGITTPSSVCSPANGMSPILSSNPSPSLGGHVSVIVSADNTSIVSDVLASNKQQDDGGKTPNTTPAGASGTVNSSGKKKSSRHHKVHAIPIADDAKCLPASYQYRVKMKDGSLQTLKATMLSRRKGVLTQEKVKFFLKATLFKTNLDSKAPLHVKDEFLKKFSVGESKVFPTQPLLLDDSTDFKPLPSSSATSSSSSSKKRNLSQSSLDMYFASSLSSNTGSSSAHKKSSKTSGKPEKATSKKKETKKSPGKNQKPVVTKSTTKSPMKHTPLKSLILVTKHSTNGSSVPIQSTSVVRSPSKPHTPRTSVKTPTKSLLLRTSSTSVIMSAKKTKTLKQIRSQLRRKFLTTDQRMKLEGEMKRKLDEQKEEKKKQLQELREKKRAEKERLIELMKPREDQLCEDSKALPEPSQLNMQVPVELFADVAMVVEFLNVFGQLFQVEEVIQRKITYDLIEEALLSKDVQGPLYDIVKFLLQAVFAAMEEDGELKVSLREINRSNCHSPTPQDPTESVTDGVDKEDGKEEQEDGGSRVKLTDASLHAMWPLLNQGVALNELVLNSYTLSEVLRMHLLSSGGYQDDPERRILRHQRRGGYTDKDNPAVTFRAVHGSILDILRHKTVFDMDAKDRILILQTLCFELLTFTMTRDAIEESKYKWKVAKRSYLEIVKKEGDRDKKKKIKIKQGNKEQKKDDHSVKEKQQAESKCNSEDAQSQQKGTNGITSLQGKGDDSIKEKQQACNTKGAKSKQKGANGVTSLPVSQQNGYCSGEEGENLKSASHSPVMESDDEEAEEERKRQKEELKLEMLQQSSMSKLEPLGVDRLHRKYWIFSSFPGLYVEQDSSQIPPQFIHSITTSPIGSDSGNNEQGTTTNTVLNSGIVSQPVMSVTEDEGTGCVWRCYSREDDFMALLDTLNPRGIREKSLKESLEMYKGYILSTIHKCPVANCTAAGKSSFKGYDGNLTAGEYLELCLRERILDFEEKIWLGGLGFAKDKRDRDEWRSNIESSGAARKIEQYYKSNNRRCSKGEDDSSPEQDESCVQRTILEVAEAHDPGAVAQELAQALLQIEQGIERKYLTAPLGTAMYKNKKQKHKKVVIKSCLDRWRSSLSEATNLSQVFLHLFTLERCVAWSRSLLNMRCRVCRRKGGDESMLLCDACDSGYHMYCLRPPLKKIPVGDWFCNDCKPATPMKPRRSTITQKAVLEALSEDSSSDGTTGYEDDSEQSDSDSSEEDEDEEEIVRRSARIQKQSTPSIPDTQSRRRGRARRASPSVTKKQQKAVTKSKKYEPPATTGKKRKPSESEKSSNNKKSRSVQSVGDKLSKITNEIASQYFEQGSNALRGKKKQAHRVLEQKLCRAILTELLGHPDSWPFLEITHHSELHFYEFDNTDLSMLEDRVESPQYRLEDFVWDVRTIFLNCPQLYRRNSEASRAGSSLERYFEVRLMELGIKMDREEQERKHRQFLYRM